MSEDVELTESQPALPNLPDRADAPVSEVTERFLRAVIAEIPVEQIEELHLFSPLRQGTLETGIAVIALRAAEPESQADGDEGGEMAPELPFETVVGEEPIDGDDAVGDEPMAANDAVGDEPIDVASEQDVHLSDATGTPEDEDEAVEQVEAVADVAEAEAPAEVPVSAPAPRPARHTVYTARYRYIIKGPERGKWESSVKAEADAPLITVETVVRGVQRRAGEESEIVRYSGAQIARALRLPPA